MGEDGWGAHNSTYPPRGLGGQHSTDVREGGDENGNADFAWHADPTLFAQLAKSDALHAKLWSLQERMKHLRRRRAGVAAQEPARTD